MEPETREFLVRIIQTISLVLVWMLVNVYFGIYKDFAFFESHANWTNYLYYVLSVEKNDGSHNFYSSANDFERGKAAYQVWLKQQRREKREENSNQ